MGPHRQIPGLNSMPYALRRHRKIIVVADVGEIFADDIFQG